MAFFEQISKKITDAGQGVAQQTKNFTDITKLNSSIHEKEKQINQLYVFLGKFYYEEYKDNSSVEKKEVFNEITELIKEISNCKEEIKQIKGIKKCSNCNADLPLDSAFCNCCGAKIVDTELNSGELSTEKNDNLMVCPNCKASIKKESVFCTKCGQQINKEG